MSLSDHTPVGDSEYTVEYRLRETLSPRATAAQGLCHGEAAEFFQYRWMLCCNSIQRIAYMQAGHRARRSFDLIAPCRRKCNHRTMKALFKTRGQDPRDALMPVLVE